MESLISATFFCSRNIRKKSLFLTTYLLVLGKQAYVLLLASWHFIQSDISWLIKVQLICYCPVLEVFWAQGHIGMGTKIRKGEEETVKVEILFAFDNSLPVKQKEMFFIRFWELPWLEITGKFSMKQFFIEKCWIVATFFFFFCHNVLVSDTERSQVHLHEEQENFWNDKNLISMGQENHFPPSTSHDFCNKTEHWHLSYDEQHCHEIMSLCLFEIDAWEWTKNKDEWLFLTKIRSDLICVEENSYLLRQQ